MTIKVIKKWSLYSFLLSDNSFNLWRSLCLCSAHWPHLCTVYNALLHLYPRFMSSLCLFIVQLVPMCTWVRAQPLGPEQSTMAICPKGNNFANRERFLQLSSTASISSNIRPWGFSPAHAGTLTGLIVHGSCADDHSGGEILSRSPCQEQRLCYTLFLPIFWVLLLHAPSCVVFPTPVIREFGIEHA